MISERVRGRQNIIVAFKHKLSIIIVGFALHSILLEVKTIWNA